MRCHVYKCLRRADTYVYLAQRDGFDALPQGLRDSFLPLSFVFEIALDPGRQLAREDAAVVQANLQQCGFHLQLPPAFALGTVADRG